MVERPTPPPLLGCGCVHVWLRSGGASGRSQPYRAWGICCRASGTCRGRETGVSLRGQRGRDGRAALRARVLVQPRPLRCRLCAPGRGRVGRSCYRAWVGRACIGKRLNSRSIGSMGVCRGIWNAGDATSSISAARPVLAGAGPLAAGALLIGENIGMGNHSWAGVSNAEPVCRHVAVALAHHLKPYCLRRDGHWHGCRCGTWGGTRRRGAEQRAASRYNV